MTSAQHTRFAHAGPNQQRRRYWGMLALLTVITSAVGVLASLSAGIHQERLSSFQVVPRKPFVQAYSPIALALHGLPPNSRKVNVPAASPRVLAISISAHNIDLYSAGKEVHSIYVAKPVATIQRLVKLVHNPAWISQTAPHQITLRSALTINPKIHLRIGGPQVHMVRMVSIPSVFIGTDGGQLDFTGVTLEAVPPFNSAASYYKPFVMATGGAVMNVMNSTFKGLGWDWNASYGTSWEDGSTGHVIDSTFENGFIGAYTGYSSNILFRDDIFRSNALYGLDPHSYSQGLVIDRVLAENNRAHGIIFSNHVTDSVIENSVSRENGENGIMMDKFSTHNRIINNMVANNTGDGLVTARSPYDVFERNNVLANRIGVRLSTGDAGRTTLTDNQVNRNEITEQHVVLDGSNTTADNGGQWNGSVLMEVWAATVSVVALLAIGLALTSRRKPQQVPITIAQW